MCNFLFPTVKNQNLIHFHSFYISFVNNILISLRKDLSIDNQEMI